MRGERFMCRQCIGEAFGTTSRYLKSSSFAHGSQCFQWFNHMHETAAMVKHAYSPLALRRY